MQETLNSLRETLPFRALNTQGGPHKTFRNPPDPKRLVIWASGGLGDALLSMNLAIAIEEYTGEKVIFYSRYWSIVSVLSGLDARDEKIFIPVGAPYWITLNTLVLFNFQRNFKGFKNPKVEEMFLSYRDFLSRGDWKFIVNRQPFMENMTGAKAVELGLNRQTLVFKMLGLPFRELRKSPGRVPKALEGKFITVHDGYDDANDKVATRSMKNWDLNKWEELVFCIKATFPDLKVVQLGGKTSRRIPGVDHDLVGQTSLAKSLQVLSQSSLHVDTESGLVHSAHMFGVKSVVLFGPTNLKFFAYDDNVNIAPKFCGDCWWLKQDWMAECPLGYIAPLCMDSIDAREVFLKVKECMNARL